MKKNGVLDFLVVGFALFTVFFGAGNLIFPPAIGIQSGVAWGSAIIGMALSAILLPVLTVVAVNNMGTDLEDLGKPVAPWFCSAYLVLFILFAGLIGVPRQGGVGIESGLFGIFPALGEYSFGLFGGQVFYFTLVFLLARKPGKVVEIVGKILTPLLLITLLYIVVMAFVKPIGPLMDTGIEQPVINAFLSGYQTGDVTVGLVIAVMFIASIRSRGYTDRKVINAVTMKSAIVAGGGLLVIYGGFMYLGATGTSLFPADMDQTALLNALVHTLVGTSGSMVLSFGIFMACLTTSIGVVSAISSMTEKVTRGKIPYLAAMIACCLIGVTIGTVGVAVIVAISYPCFFLIYPASIVLTLLGVFRKFVPNHGAWKGAVLMAALVGLYEAIGMWNTLGVMNVHITAIDNLYAAIPLSSMGLAWFIPSIIGFIVGAVVVKQKKGEAYPMLEQ